MQPVLQWTSNKYYTIRVSIFVALVTQHAKHMRHIVVWPALLYKILLHFLINGKIFEKKKSLNIQRIFRVSLQILSDTFLILRRTERDMIKNV